MLLEGENEALSRGLSSAFAWAAPDLVRLGSEDEILDTLADVLHWSGLQVVVLRHRDGVFTAGPMRLAQTRIDALEGRFGAPIRIGPPVSNGLLTLGGHAQVLERDFELLDSVPAGTARVAAAIATATGRYGLLIVEAPRFSPSAVQLVGHFARLAGAALENLGERQGLREHLAALRHAQRSMLAEERLSVLGEAAAVLAHEIRNPLATVSNALALLRRGAQPPGELLGIVEDEVARLDALTHDLLQLARPLEPRRQLFDLGLLIHSTVERLRAGSSELRIAIDARQRVEISADPALLQLALENLLRNASQACPSRGEVKVILSSNPGETLVAVEDEGPGIDPADRARIFEPFFTTRATGTGLGLPIVKRIVQAHGGVVRVADAAAGGARFEMVLTRC